MSAAKHMTEETHGRGRRDRRTERIQVTHLLPKRIVSITQQKRMCLLLMSTDEWLWICSVGVQQPDWGQCEDEDSRSAFGSGERVSSYHVQSS